MDVELNKITEKLELHEKRIQKLESLLEKNLTNSEKKISIREFIISKKPENAVEKTLVIGYYLEKFKKMKCFTKKDILKGFKDSKEKNIPPEKKIYDKISSNIQKGHMMEAEEKKDNSKAWLITITGETYVETKMGYDE